MSLCAYVSCVSAPGTAILKRALGTDGKSGVPMIAFRSLIAVNLFRFASAINHIASRVMPTREQVQRRYNTTFAADDKGDVLDLRRR